jgi:hypothetical protein
MTKCSTSSRRAVSKRYKEEDTSTLLNLAFPALACFLSIVQKAFHLQKQLGEKRLCSEEGFNGWY